MKKAPYGKKDGWVSSLCLLHRCASGYGCTHVTVGRPWVTVDETSAAVAVLDRLPLHRDGNLHQDVLLGWRDMVSEKRNGERNGGAKGKLCSEEGLVGRASIKSIQLAGEKCWLEKYRGRGWVAVLDLAGCRKLTKKPKMQNLQPNLEESKFGKPKSTKKLKTQYRFPFRRGEKTQKKGGVIVS